MKMLSVVFLVYREGEHNLILMGRQAPGKRMPGVRNGFGGKCEPEESVEDCAVRELMEEAGIEIKKEDLRYVGLLIEGEKHVYFYTVESKCKLEIPDNDEMVDVRWFDADTPEEFLSEMLPGNDEPMRHVALSLVSASSYEPFTMDLSGNAELIEATKNIFDTT